MSSCSKKSRSRGSKKPTRLAKPPTHGNNWFGPTGQRLFKSRIIVAIPPWQTGKFVAALQSASAPPNPVLLEVNYDSGHFTEEKVVGFRDFANQMAFPLWQTGHKDFQPVK